MEKFYKLFHGEAKLPFWFVLVSYLFVIALIAVVLLIFKGDLISTVDIFK